MRAYTPAEQKAVRAAAQSFRENPAFKTEDVILELGTGEALVSFLDESGRPSIVENAKVLPPQCLMAAPDSRYANLVIVDQMDLSSKYATAIDAESAFEVLAAKAQAEEQAAAEAKAAKEQAEAEAKAAKEQAAAEAKVAKEAERKAAAEERARQKRADQLNKTVNSVVGQVGREVGRQLIRGLFGSLKR